MPSCSLTAPRCPVEPRVVEETPRFWWPARAGAVLAHSVAPRHHGRLVPCTSGHAVAQGDRADGPPATSRPSLDRQCCRHRHAGRRRRMLAGHARADAAGQGRVAIKVSNEVPSSSDLGVGAHRIPDTLVYVTGYFTDAMETGKYFGALGMIAADASAKGTAEKKSAQLAPLRLDIPGTAHRVLADRMRRADASRFAAPNAGDVTIEITPYLVVTT